MKKSYCSDSSKPDRKTVEKTRRIHMKGLCFKLASLIPKTYQFSKNKTSQQDRLDHAAFYIKDLQDRVEELKKKKQSIIGSKTQNSAGLKLPVLEITDMDSTMEVVLICNITKNFMFHEVISILQEEGADVVNATFSRVGDTVFHTIHSQVTSSTVGLENSKIFDRLKVLITY